MSGASGHPIDKPDSISGSEDEVYEEKARTSEDVRRHDRETLTAEEEAERLLGGENEEKGASFGRRLADRREARRQRRREARRGKRKGRRGDGEGGELLYDTEHGRRSSSESSSEADLRRLKETQSMQKVCVLTAVRTTARED